MGTSVNFENSFRRGFRSYNGAVGNWWFGQSLNVAHKKAYRQIVDYTVSFCKRRKWTPGLVVDYACGPGDVLLHLARGFPDSRIIGLDGSRVMLERAEEMLGKHGIEGARMTARRAFSGNGGRVNLVETYLPNFSLPKEKADLVLFVFPNIVPTMAEQPYYEKHGYNNRKDAKVGWFLANFQEKNPKDDIDMEPDQQFDQLLTNKVISRNVAHLLKKGGINVRADYAGSGRKGLTKGALLRTDFEQGALAGSIEGTVVPVRLFEIVYSTYKRSNVIIDVYHQTQKSDDKDGGYLLSTLRKL